MKIVHLSSPTLLTTIALNCCLLIQEGHIDNLVRIVYDHFPLVTLIRLNATRGATRGHDQSGEIYAGMPYQKHIQRGVDAAPQMYGLLEHAHTLETHLGGRLWHAPRVPVVVPGVEMRRFEQRLERRLDRVKFLRTEPVTRFFDDLLDVFASTKFLRLAQGLPNDDPEYRSTSDECLDVL